MFGVSIFLEQLDKRREGKGEIEVLGGQLRVHQDKQEKNKNLVFLYLVCFDFL